MPENTSNEQLFEGTPVLGTLCKVAGDVGDRLVNPELHIGDIVVMVCVGAVTKVQYAEHHGHLHRFQQIAVSDGYLVPAGVDQDDLLHRLRADRQRALDEILGTPTLPMDDR